eukprot:COSAG01_NODE_1775_length_9260_cov_58.468784_11_plen_216_part_00
MCHDGGPQRPITLTPPPPLQQQSRPRRKRRRGPKSASTTRHRSPVDVSSSHDHVGLVGGGGADYRQREPPALAARHPALGIPWPPAQVFAWPLEIAWPRAPSHRIPWPTNSSYGLQPYTLHTPLQRTCTAAKGAMGEPGRPGQTVERCPQHPRPPQGWPRSGLGAATWPGARRAWRMRHAAIMRVQHQTRIVFSSTVADPSQLYDSRTRGSMLAT